MHPKAGSPQNLLLALLLAAGGIQAGLVLTNYGTQWFKAAWRTRSLSAMDRNARFLLGQTGMEYMRFLLRAIPARSTVVVPDAAGPFSAQNNLQFFLMPRRILACACAGAKSTGWTDECAECLRGEGLAVPAINDFPPHQVMEGIATFVAFDEATDVFRGVYIPLPTGEAAPAGTSPATSDLRAVAVSLLRSVLVLLLVAALGVTVCRALLGMADWRDLLPLAVPVGLGVLTWGTFVVAWLSGGGVSLRTFLSVCFTSGALSLWIAHRQCSFALHQRLDILNRVAGGLRNLRESAANPIVLAIVLGSAVFLSLSVIISVARGYSIFDDIANWALKGYAISFFGSIYAGQEWGGHGLAYPQNIHLGIAMFRMMDGDILPGSKLIFPAFFFSLIGGCFRFWRRHAVSRTLAAAGAFGLMTIPVLYTHSTTGYANLPYSAYLVLGTLWVAHGLEKGQSRPIALGALLFGLAAWTRPEGVGYAGVMLALLWISSRRPRMSIGKFALWAAPFALISAVWLAFGTAHQARDEIGATLSTFVEGLFTGGLSIREVPHLLTYSLQALLRPEIWGALLPLLVILALLAYGMRRGETPTAARAVGLAGVTAGLMVLGMFWIAQPSHQNAEFLDFSFDRAAFPAAILLLWAGLAASGRERARSVPGGTMLAAPGYDPD